jgi:hypothetical protein
VSRLVLCALVVAALLSFRTQPPALEAPRAEAPPTPGYTAFDFLRDYLTNRTYPTIVRGKPWTNNTVNWGEYQKELGGVTYWDFFSEPENWDSPSYLWRDDEGNWRAYAKQTLRDPAGREVLAYQLVDRQGPGAMDKIWFTEDAVWMLTTERSIRDVGPIENMDNFLEWGDIPKLGNLRIEVDDRIAYDGPIVDWLSGKAWGLSPDLARILTWRHREFGSSGTLLPVLYRERLRMWLYGGSKKPKWFQATGVRFAADTRVVPYTGARSDLPLEEMGRLARNVLQPDSYIDTLDGVRAFDLSVPPVGVFDLGFVGAGTVESLQFRISKWNDPRSLRLRVKYGSIVAIDLPVIGFFGDPEQLVFHRSTPLGIVDAGDAFLFYCNLPLPFQNGMTLELASEGPLPITVAARLALSTETTNTQLWVDYREPEKLVMHGPDYEVRLPGDGKMVGLVLVTEEQGLDRIPKTYVPGKPGEEDPVKRAWPMGYLEGNLTLTDGTGANRVFGGQEDWADGGFYFNRGYTSPPGGSNRPFGGILRYQDGNDGYATLFRYFDDLSAFTYHQGLRLAFGHGTWQNNFPVRYGTTIYYYREIVGTAK